MISRDATRNATGNAMGKPGGRISRAAIGLLLLILSGCTVGPRYKAPQVVPPPAYKESAPEAYKGAVPGAWQPAQPQDSVLKGKWWEVFKEPELNALEDQLNINNQNIAQYFQNFMAARAQVREARANYFPTVTTAPAYSRTRTPGTVGVVAASRHRQGAEQVRPLHRPSKHSPLPR
jgi:outer membrane protein TolC